MEQGKYKAAIYLVSVHKGHFLRKLSGYSAICKQE